MAWSKSPQSLIDLFAESLPDGPGIERRKMFGVPAVFVNGNMFAGILGDAVFARVPPDLRTALERDHHAKVFEPIPGRPMKAYLELPDAVLADEDALAETLAAAYRHAAGLPPKEKKPPRERKRPTSAKA